MQIRTRGTKTEFLRGTWDPAKKRTVQKLIKPVDFTEAEQAQHDAWAAQRQAKLDADRARWAAQDLASAIERAVAGMDAGVTPREPERVLAALDQLRGRLRKAGIKRSMVKAPVVVPPPAE